jgi:hypothetical protein
VLSTIVPRAAALSRTHPGIELSLIDLHPVEALRALRTGHMDVALIFRYADTPADAQDVRLVHLLDEPIYLVSRQARDTVTAYRDSPGSAAANDARPRKEPARV